MKILSLSYYFTLLHKFGLDPKFFTLVIKVARFPTIFKNKLYRQLSMQLAISLAIWYILSKLNDQIFPNSLNILR